MVSVDSKCCWHGENVEGMGYPGDGETLVHPYVSNQLRTLE
jgi:hypothetical protein